MGRVMMRALMVVAVLVGCKQGDQPVTPDGAPPPPDARPDADFFGEPCGPPSTPSLIVTCRSDAPQADKGYCTPSGVCRPFCGYYAAGTYYAHCPGNETWTNPNGELDRGTCYCEP